ncbi:hypothetical protein D3C72_2104780 [compost metagenome]
MEIHTRQAGLGTESYRRELIAGGFAEVVQLAQVFDNRFSLGGIVCQRGEQGTLPQLLATHTGRGMQGTATTVAESDGAGLVEHQHMHVTGGFHGTAGTGNHVQTHQAIHTGDTDG